MCWNTQPTQQVPAKVDQYNNTCISEEKSFVIQYVVVGFLPFHSRPRSLAHSLSLAHSALTHSLTRSLHSHSRRLSLTKTLAHRRLSFTEDSRSRIFRSLHSLTKPPLAHEGSRRLTRINSLAQTYCGAPLTHRHTQPHLLTQTCSSRLTLALALSLVFRFSFVALLFFLCLCLCRSLSVWSLSCRRRCLFVGGAVCAAICALPGDRRSGWLTRCGIGIGIGGGKVCSTRTRWESSFSLRLSLRAGCA